MRQERDVDEHEDQQDNDDHSNAPSESMAMFTLKIAASVLLLWSSFTTLSLRNGDGSLSLWNVDDQLHRRLTEAAVGDSIPTYMEPMMKDLRERKKLMEETPPEEVKYWFEYTGPLQVCHCIVLFYAPFSVAAIPISLALSWSVYFVHPCSYASGVFGRK